MCLPPIIPFLPQHSYSWLTTWPPAEFSDTVSETRTAKCTLAMFFYCERIFEYNKLTHISSRHAVLCTTFLNYFKYIHTKRLSHYWKITTSGKPWKLFLIYCLSRFSKASGKLSWPQCEIAPWNFPCWFLLFFTEQQSQVHSMIIFVKFISSTILPCFRISFMNVLDTDWWGRFVNFATLNWFTLKC